MSNALQIGIIGTGGIAGQHINALSGMENVELAAFCDVMPSRAEAAVSKHGGKSYSSPETMFSDTSLDAVWICLPPFAHGPAERSALTNRVPFFVEKPVGLDAGICREIAAEVEKTGLLTSVGYMNRYRHSVQVGKSLLKEDAPVLAYGAWIGRGPGAGHWWVEKAKSGGQLIEQTTHTVDLVRYLCGEAVEVFAYATRGFNKGIEKYDIEDASTVVVKMQNGAVVNIMSDCAASVGGGVFLNVYGSATCLRYSGWEHSVVVERAGQEPEKIPGEESIFSLEDEAFVEAIRTGNRALIRCDYADGWKTAALALAADKSMRTGMAVSL